MSFFSFDCIIGVKKPDDLIKEFSLEISRQYRRTDVKFKDSANPNHTEYVFPFVSYIDGRECKRLYRISFASDGLRSRFKSTLRDASSNDEKQIAKRRRNLLRCKEYIEKNGEKKAADESRLPVQSKSEAFFLKQMFFIRLLSDWLTIHNDNIKEIGLHMNDEGNLVDINNRIADIYLMEIVFYQHEITVIQNQKSTEDYIEFLFSDKKSSKERLADFEQISPNVAENINEDDFRLLIEQLRNHPLLSHYLKWGESQKEKEDNRKDLITLLRQCLYYRDKDDPQSGKKRGFYIVPVVDDIILNKRNRVREIISKEKFSPHAYYKFLGRIAEKASQQDNDHYISAKSVYRMFTSEKEFVDNDYVKELEERVDRENKSGVNVSETVYGRGIYEFNWFNAFIELDKNGKKYRFKDKILKLFFTANYICMDYNEFFLFDRLLACCGITNKTGKDLDNSTFDFDNLILLSTMTLHLLPWESSRRFLRYLATEQANKYDIASRHKQKAAIAIISYSGLWESPLIDNSLRELLFKAAYGYTIYDFQNKLIDILLEQPFYVEIIRKHFQKIKKNPDKEQPIYFYLYHNVSIIDKLVDSPNTSMYSLYNESTIRKCFLYRDTTWRNNFTSANEMSEFEQFVVDTIQKADLFFDIKKPLEPSYENIIQIYAIQALLFAIANYSRIASIDFVVQGKKAKLMKTVIFCDYYTRKFDDIYKRMYSGKPVSAEEQKKMFLLCGPFRVSCLGNHKLDKKIVISKNMKSDYKTWLGNEDGRYKVLLMRLLAYSDFYEKNPINAEDIPNVSNEDFLNYDNVDIEEVYRSKISKDEALDPLNWYKKRK